MYQSKEDKQDNMMERCTYVFRGHVHRYNDSMNRTVGMRDALRARQTGDRTFVVIAISDERDEHRVYQTHDMVGEDASNVPYITLTAIVREEEEEKKKCSLNF